MKLNTITEVLEDLSKGKQVIVIDDEDRENEGDLIVAGSLTKPSDINFMATHGRGLICVPMEGARLDGLVTIICLLFLKKLCILLNKSLYTVHRLSSI